jgi:hypothetical protein
MIYLSHCIPEGVAEAFQISSETAMFYQNDYITAEISDAEPIDILGLRQHNIASERYLNSSSSQRYLKQFGRKFYIVVALDMVNCLNVKKMYIVYS